MNSTWFKQRPANGDEVDRSWFYIHQITKQLIVFVVYYFQLPAQFHNFLLNQLVDSLTGDTQND